MFETGFTYILSKSLMNTRTRLNIHKRFDPWILNFLYLHIKVCNPL